MNGSRAEPKAGPPAVPRRLETGGGGLWLRLLAVAALPLALLAAAGFLFARSLGVAGDSLATETFQRSFLIAFLLLLLLAALLTRWLHASLGSRLRALRRALAGGRAAEARALERETGWGEIPLVAREAVDLLERTHAARAEAEELAQLRDLLESLTARLEEWSATEVSGELRLDPELGALAPALETLHARLVERDQEAHQAVRLALETSRESRGSVELAGREASKATVEATALMRDLADLRREVGSPRRTEAAAGAAAAETPNASPPPLGAAAAACARFRSRLEEEERRALALALVLTAARLRAGDREPGVASSEETALAGALEAGAGGLREMGLACRSLGEETRALEDELSAAGAWAEDRARSGETPDAARAVPGGKWRETLRVRLAELERRGERLATLCDRAERHAVLATRLAVSVEEDVRGLGSRYESAPGSLPDPPTATELPDPPARARRATSGPLRLLTRDDVVAEAGDDEEVSEHGDPGRTPPGSTPSGARGDG